MHQPNFLPWIGLFDKMANADVFVLLDDVETPDGSSWANRTLIKTPDGDRFLTLPIHSSRGDTYRTARVAAETRQLEKLWKTIHCNYARCPHFACYAPQIQDWLVTCAGYSLAVVNVDFIYHVRYDLGIDTKLVLQSALGVTSHKNNLIIDLCHALNCDTYLSGQGAKAYNDGSKLKDAGIELVYQNFSAPSYDQPWGDFSAALSIIDALFNCGGETRSFFQ
mgnify:CR=1 FL=1